MKHYVGLDVAMNETAICIVDDERRVVREGKAASERKPLPRSWLRPDWLSNGSASRQGLWRPGCATAWPRRACR
jgi:hypothetical protein